MTGWLAWVIGLAMALAVVAGGVAPSSRWQWRLAAAGVVAAGLLLAEPSGETVVALAVLLLVVRVAAARWPLERPVEAQAEAVAR